MTYEATDGSEIFLTFLRMGLRSNWVASLILRAAKSSLSPLRSCCAPITKHSTHPSYKTLSRWFSPLRCTSVHCVNSGKITASGLK